MEQNEINAEREGDRKGFLGGHFAHFNGCGVVFLQLNAF